MKTILVDADLETVKKLTGQLQDIKGVELAGCFHNSKEALRYARTNRVEYALLEVVLPDMDGLRLGAELKKINPDMVLMFMNHSLEFYPAACKALRADYYLLKPLEEKDIKDAVERALLLCKRQKKRVQIQTFGRFALFIDGTLINFQNKKAKELLALCVDKRGCSVEMEEAIDKLWEGTPVSEAVKVRYRKAVSYLNRLFAEKELEGIFESGYGTCYIHKENIDCDYYDFIDKGVVGAFNGEYMEEYSWAETTVGWLEKNKNFEKKQ